MKNNQHNEPKIEPTFDRVFRKARGVNLTSEERKKIWTAIVTSTESGAAPFLNEKEHSPSRSWTRDIRVLSIGFLIGALAILIFVRPTRPILQSDGSSNPTKTTPVNQVPARHITTPVHTPISTTTPPHMNDTVPTYPSPTVSSL